jgi:hypothetical protein
MLKPISLVISITVLAIAFHYENAKPGLVMKAYDYLYASEGEERQLRRGGGGGRSSSSSRSYSYSGYSGYSYGGYTGRAVYLSAVYGSSYYIPAAYRYTYTLGYYGNRDT